MSQKPVSYTQQQIDILEEVLSHNMPSGFLSSAELSAIAYAIGYITHSEAYYTAKTITLDKPDNLA